MEATDLGWPGCSRIESLGGERGIRTLGTVLGRTHAFQACAFNHSAISPRLQLEHHCYATSGKRASHTLEAPAATLDLIALRSG